jgi:hypothetical protein
VSVKKAVCDCGGVCVCIPVGVTVVKLDIGPAGLVRRLLDAVEHVLLRDHGAAGHGRVGQALGAGDHVGSHIELHRRERIAESAEAGDDLVEDEQDVVLVADLADALEVAHGRREHAGAARDGLNDLEGKRNKKVRSSKPMRKGSHRHQWCTDNWYSLAVQKKLQPKHRRKAAYVPRRRC